MSLSSLFPMRVETPRLLSPCARSPSRALPCCPPAVDCCPLTVRDGRDTAKPPAEWDKRGEEVFRAVYRDSADGVQKMLNDAYPDLGPPRSIPLSSAARPWRARMVLTVPSHRCLPLSSTQWMRSDAHTASASNLPSPCSPSLIAYRPDGGP